MGVKVEGLSCLCNKQTCPCDQGPSPRTVVCFTGTTATVVIGSTLFACQWTSNIRPVAVLS